MLDQIIGRPSNGWKRTQVIILSLITILILKRQSPPLGFIKRLNDTLLKYPPWKISVGTILALYLFKNTFLLSFMSAPEPLAKQYTHSFFRVSWIITALDAGFLTAMKIKPKWLRDIMSVLLSIVYLFDSDAAESKVRKFKACSTIDMLRVSWEKQLNPYIRSIGIFHRGFLAIREDISFERPQPPSKTSFPKAALGCISARLYSSKPLSQIKNTRKLIIQVPGGGFVTMNPKCHDDYVSEWARQINGTPILAINYKKAPEFPYPWALEEVFDAYRSIIESNGEVIGLTGWYEKDSNGNAIGNRREPLKIVIIGDSAGANLIVGTILKCITETRYQLPLPCGVLMLYPCLSFDLACWMTQNHLSVIRDSSTSNLGNILHSRSRMSLASPLAVPEAPREINLLKDQVDRSLSWYVRILQMFYKPETEREKNIIPSELSMTSRMSFFNDRIIQPEVLRAMALYYLGSSPKSLDLENDYYLSSVLAPSDLLAKFPPIFFLTGEKDPFVDDTMIFSNRLRASQSGNNVRVKILEGISHGFMQFTSIFPLASQAIKLTSGWIEELFDNDYHVYEPMSHNQVMNRRRQELADIHL